MDWQKVIEVLTIAADKFGLAAAEGEGNTTAFASGMVVCAALAEALKAGLEEEGDDDTITMNQATTGSLAELYPGQGTGEAYDRSGK